MSGTFPLDGGTREVENMPGHAPGSTCRYAPELGVLFGADTLFQGGPGATGRSISSFERIISSGRERVLILAPATEVRTGHGGSTSIVAEVPRSGVPAQECQSDFPN